MPLRTMYSSGSIEPLTSASPSPRAALMTISSASPVIGLTVKPTPDTSDRTIRWIRTAISIESTDNPAACR